MGQSGNGGQIPEVEGREGAMEGRLYEGTALKVEAENCEDSLVEDSRACVDRQGVTACVDSRRRREDMILAVSHSQRAL